MAARSLRWTPVAVVLLAVLMLPGAVSVADHGAGSGLASSGLAGSLLRPAATGPGTLASAPPNSEESNSTCPETGPAEVGAVAEAQHLVSTGAVGSSDAYLPAVPARTAAAPFGIAATYVSPPAPMGLADLGEGAAGSYAYNATTVEGVAQITALASDSPGYSVWAETPDWVSLQLNAVGVNLPYPGSHNGSFWAQDVARFNGTELQFVDNIWNFSNASGGGLMPGTLSSFGGTYLPCDFYYDAGPAFSIDFPLSIQLYDTIGVSHGQPYLSFDYNLTDPSGTASGSFDTVRFNGTAELGRTPVFEVNGSTPNPFGLRDDAELVLGGDGSGTNAMVDDLNATLALYHSFSGGTYTPVTSAYDFGPDTAETSEGVAAYYVGTTEFLDQGPSFLYGLWNTTATGGVPSAAPGWIRLNLTENDPDGFLFATNGSSAGYSSASVVPTNASGVAVSDLPPPPSGGSYDFAAWANGRSPSATVAVESNATANATVTLAADPGAFDAPIVLRSEADVAALATDNLSGVHVAANGATLWVNDTDDALAAPFRQLNDYGGSLFELFEDEVGRGLTVHLNNFTQAATTFTYTRDVESGISLPGWSQGYFLYFPGNGSTASNISTIGPRLLAPPIVIRSPGALEMYGANDAVLTNFTVNGTGTALVLVDNQNATIRNLTSEGIAQGAYVLASNDTTVENVTVLSDLPPGADDDVVTPSARAAGTAGTTGSVESTGWWLAPTCKEVVFGILPSVLRDDDGADGVCALYGTNLSVTGGTVLGDGGWGLMVRGMSNVATSSWYVANLGTAGQFDTSTNISVDDVEVANAIAGGWNFTYDRGVAAWDLLAVGNSTTAFDGANGTTGIRIWKVQGVDDGIGAYGVYNSTDIAIWNVTATTGGYGAVYFGFDHNLTARNFSATGGSGGLSTLWTYNATVTNITATGGSQAYLALGGSNQTISDLTARGDSVAAELTDLSNSTVEDVNVSTLSVGVGWTNGNDVRVRDVRSGNESTGVYLQGVATASVSDVNASAPGLGSPYFVNTVYGVPYPAAAVATWTTSNVSVSDVAASNYGFAVWDLNSANLSLADVRAWNGNVAVQSNYSSDVTVSQLFAYGEGDGVELVEPFDATLEASTIEDSESFGVEVLGGINTTAFGNNFVGNDGASVTGQYTPAHPQVAIEFEGTGNFSWDGIGNYWSDRNSTVPYAISSAVSDADPAPSFFSQWLAFNESGLTPGLGWSIALDGITYSTTNPVFYLPGWSAPSAPAPFLTLPPVGWHATPRSGTVSGTPANATVSIQFGEPYYPVSIVATGLPAGTTWSAEFGGVVATNTTAVSGGTLRYSMPNGTYSYRIFDVSGYHASGTPYSGQELIFGGGANLSLSFSRVVYTVTFVQDGLPAGTHWTVTFDGTLAQAYGGALRFTAPNGSYAYAIGGIPGWFQSSRNYVGAFDVSGANATVTTVWSPVEYALTFSEGGLASGTEWGVYLNGALETTTAPTLTFTVTNGTYAYLIDLPVTAGYSATAPTGTVTVNGTAAAQPLQFYLTNHPPITSYLGFWVFTGGAAAFALVVAVRSFRARSHPSRGARGPAAPPPAARASTTPSDRPHYVEDVPKVEPGATDDRTWGAPQPVDPTAYDPPAAPK